MRFATKPSGAVAKRLVSGSRQALRAGLGLGRRSRTLLGAGIVALSAGVVASMIASVALGSYGDQVFARNGDANRGPESGGAAPAATSYTALASLPAPRWTENADRPFAGTRMRVSHRWTAERHWTRIATARATGHHSVCVRLCDGFFYPVGDVHGASDLDTQTAVCASSCPGAPTRLFVTPSDERDMSKAVAVPDGKPYTALPVAFAHTTEVGPTCTCHADGEHPAALMTPLRDITMRNGDSVMTAAGWRVFRGNGHWPYKPTNFTTLAAARGLPSHMRTTLAALEDASLGHVPNAGISGIALDIHKRKHRFGAAGDRVVGLNTVDLPQVR